MRNKTRRRVSLVNLCTADAGNPALPEKLKRAEAIVPETRPKPARRMAALVATGIGALIALIILAAVLLPLLLRSRSQTAAGASSTSSPKSIAVLPFENLSSDKDNAYFAEGIQDEILTRLAKIADLKVISRTSTQKYKSAPDNLRDVGKQLGVATLLEGSVQKISNAVLVNVQLIRVANDEHIWAESYKRKLDDVFAVEAEVATAIAEQLNAKLTGAEQKVVTNKPTENPAAYDAYLRAISVEQTRTDDASLLDAANNYAAAVRLDPKFALAWAHLAVIRSRLFFNGTDPTINTATAVKEAADQALSAQPPLGEAFVAQGVYRYRVLRDFHSALESYQEALKRLPNSSFVSH